MEQIRRDQAIQRRMQEPIDDLLSGFKQLKQHRPRSEAVAMSFDHAAHELQVSRDSYHAAFYARDTLGRQAFFGSVSYTHLDVYKRQLRDDFELARLRCVQFAL